MWQWQGSAQTSESGPGSSGSGHAGSSGGQPGTQGAGGGTTGAPGQQQELTDMLQILDSSGTTSFEDLNMFNTNFE